jgi:hypothetical protein
MKNSGKMLVCVMSGLALCTPAGAVTSESAENPYQSIVDRNVFSLKPPPAPADPAEANKPQVLKITLTGITTILGNKRVLMKTAPPQAKPGEAPKTEQSYILTEGQREGDIEVIEINDKLGSVKVSNGGTVQTLTFEKDGAKLPATPAPAVPGVPLPNGAAPIPGLPVAHPPGGAPAGGPAFQLPTRVPRLPTPGAQASAANVGGFGGVAPNAAPSVPGLYLPGNSTTPVQAGTPQGQQVAAPQMSLEEQAIMIEANRQAGGPGAALLPPTALTPRASPSTPANSGQNSTIPTLPMPGRPIQPGQY